MAKVTTENGTPITPASVGRAGSTMFIVPSRSAVGHAQSFALAATTNKGETVPTLDLLAVRLCAVDGGLRGRMAKATGEIVAADVRFMRTNPAANRGVWHEFRRNANGIACIGHGDGVCDAKSRSEGYRNDGLAVPEALASAEATQRTAQRNFAAYIEVLRRVHKRSDADIVATPHVAQLLRAGLKLPARGNASEAPKRAPAKRASKVATTEAPTSAEALASE